MQTESSPAKVRRTRVAEHFSGHLILGSPGEAFRLFQRLVASDQKLRKRMTLRALVSQSPSQRLSVDYISIRELRIIFDAIEALGLHLENCEFNIHE